MPTRFARSVPIKLAAVSFVLAFSSASRADEPVSVWSQYLTLTDLLKAIGPHTTARIVVGNVRPNVVVGIFAKDVSPRDLLERTAETAGLRIRFDADTWTISDDPLWAKQELLAAEVEADQIRQLAARIESAQRMRPRDLATAIERAADLDRQLRDHLSRPVGDRDDSWHNRFRDLTQRRKSALGGDPILTALLHDLNAGEKTRFLGPGHVVASHEIDADSLMQTACTKIDAPLPPDSRYVAVLRRSSDGTIGWSVHISSQNESIVSLSGTQTLPIQPVDVSDVRTALDKWLAGGSVPKLAASEAVETLAARAESYAKATGSPTVCEAPRLKVARPRASDADPFAAFDGVARRAGDWTQIKWREAATTRWRLPDEKAVQQFEAQQSTFGDVAAFASGVRPVPGKLLAIDGWKPDLEIAQPIFRLWQLLDSTQRTTLLAARTVPRSALAPAAQAVFDEIILESESVELAQQWAQGPDRFGLFLGQLKRGKFIAKGLGRTVEAESLEQLRQFLVNLSQSESPNSVKTYRSTEYTFYCGIDADQAQRFVFSIDEASPLPD